MTATVTLLASHRRKHEQPETCKRCRPEQTCPWHQLIDLRARLVAARGTDLADEALADALAVIETILRPSAADERTTP